MALGVDTVGDLNYPTTHTDFQVIIQPATCNCNLLIWDEPPQVTGYTKLMNTDVYEITLDPATINADSEQAEPAIRSCTGNNACPRNSNFVLVDKATGALDTAFMEFVEDTLLFRVTPTVSSQIKQYTMELTQTVYTGHDPIVMDVVILDVDCIIEEIQAPTPLSGVIYHLMSAAQEYDMTPQFTQYPPCDYVL